MKKITHFLTFLVILLPFADLVAEEDWGDGADEWADTWQDERSESPWTVSGFSDLGAGDFVESNIVEHKQSLLESRSQLSASRYIGATFFSSKTDIVFDDISEDKAQLEIRELYIDHGLSDHWSVRAGQQVLTWGTGDFVFLNDFFPKNWQSMFSGRDDDYLKAPSAAVKTSFYSPTINTDIVFVPDFTSDVYITGERFSYFNPAAQSTFAAPPKVKAEDPSKSLSNSQLFLRLFRTRQGIEYAAYFYRGFYTQPLGFSLASGKNIFPRLNSYGGSVRAPVLGGIGNMEFSYWDSVDDSDNPLIPNSQVHWLAGFEKEALRNLTMGVQLLVRNTRDLEPERDAAFNEDYVLDDWQKLLTLRLSHMALQQKLTSSFFVFHSPNDKDYFVKPKLSYRFDDHWFYTIGANYFSGENNYTQWGQFEKNSNLYVRVKYSF